MPATATRQLVPDEILARWEAGRPAVLQEKEHSASGGPPKLLEKLAKAQAAFDEWERPRRELAEAKAEMQQWQEANTKEFSAWSLAAHIAPVITPLVKQLERLHASVLASQDERPHAETARKAKAYQDARLALSKIHEDPPEDLEQAIRDILAKLPPLVSTFEDWTN